MNDQTNAVVEPSIDMSGDFTHPLGQILKAAYDQADSLRSDLPDWIVEMEGMSGRKYRYLINHLVRNTPNPRYLEVGSWTGSTACAALHGNPLTICCIDNWSEFHGPKKKFLANIERCRGSYDQFSLVESDFREVDYNAMPLFNIYLFDGPHDYQDQYDGIELAQPALADEFILIVDDWNWKKVRDGTNDALAKLKLNTIARIDIRTTLDESYPVVTKQDSDWHNGYSLMVCQKP